MRYAVIGIGTNSCRLLIATRESDQWKIEHHDIRTLLRSFEDHFTAIGGDVEVANVKVRGKVGQRALRAG